MASKLVCLLYVPPTRLSSGGDSLVPGILADLLLADELRESGPAVNEALVPLGDAEGPRQAATSEGVLDMSGHASMGSSCLACSEQYHNLVQRLERHFCHYGT